MNKRTKGFEYEELSKKYLINQGLEYIESNFYTKFGEIDLIFLENSEVLVFVEVKYRSSNRYGVSLEAINYQKQKRMINTGNVYITKINWEQSVRYDIIGIDKEKITWIKNAFGVM